MIANTSNISINKPINMNNQIISSVANPTNNNDVSTKGYTDTSNASTLLASESYTNSYIPTQIRDPL